MDFKALTQKTYHSKLANVQRLNLVTVGFGTRLRFDTIV